MQDMASKWEPLRLRRSVLLLLFLLLWLLLLLLWWRREQELKECGGLGNVTPSHMFLHGEEAKTTSRG